MKLIYWLSYLFDLATYPIRYIVYPQPFKEMWGVRDIVLVQIELQRIAKESQKYYQEKINKEMEANRLRMLALEQDKEDGQDI